ncbi:MAG TPA: CPBP family intramembrane glutamic endopeptidase [Caproicibacter sp.]|nr:CPBP family intramembrane glutamic endopeptidase [Caproicibacter sp.]
MAETIILYMVTLIPLVVYLAVALFGQKSKHLKTFRESMLKNYRPALIISLIFYLGPFIGTLNPQKLWNIPAAADIFCISSFGLAMAKSIAGCEPLPVTDSIIKREKVLKKVMLTVAFSLIIVLVSGIIGSFGFNLCLSVFHEPDKRAQAMQMLPYKNKWLSFFTLLAGAGIAEEATYRLFFLTLFWKLLKNPWFALVLSSLCFSLYHLTPLDTMYQVYWQFPIAQVIGVFLSSLIFGFFYIKRGFETCVLGHTLLDWTSVIF